MPSGACSLRATAFSAPIPAEAGGRAPALADRTILARSDGCGRTTSRRRVSQRGPTRARSRPRHPARLCPRSGDADAGGCPLPISARCSLRLPCALDAGTPNARTTRGHDAAMHGRAQRELTRYTRLARAAGPVSSPPAQQWKAGASHLTNLPRTPARDFLARTPLAALGCTYPSRSPHRRRLRPRSSLCESRRAL